MQVRVSPATVEQLDVAALVVPIFSDGGFDGAAQAWDTKLGGTLSEIVSSGEISGKAGETALVHVRDLPVRRILVVGLGERKSVSARRSLALRGCCGPPPRQARGQDAPAARKPPPKSLPAHSADNPDKSFPSEPTYVILVR